MALLDVRIVVFSSIQGREMKLHSFLIEPVNFELRLAVVNFFFANFQPHLFLFAFKF